MRDSGPRRGDYVGSSKHLILSSAPSSSPSYSSSSFLSSFHSSSPFSSRSSFHSSPSSHSPSPSPLLLFSSFPISILPLLTPPFTPLPLFYLLPSSGAFLASPSAQRLCYYLRPDVCPITLSPLFQWVVFNYLLKSIFSRIFPPHSSPLSLPFLLINIRPIVHPFL